MEWPIKISQPGAQGKCEFDANKFYYEQNHREKTPGEMYQEMGWEYGNRPLSQSPFKEMFVWWRWGN